MEARPPQIQVHHLERLAVVYVRQSSPKQVRENQGSTYAQQDLAELPRRWGWPDSRIRVILDDLGLTATTTDGRWGLRDLLDWMARGEVSLVIVREVARLSREPLDSETFLRTAIRSGVLIEANGKVYDTATADLAELFGFRIQALLAWYENAQRVQIFQTAKVAKVRRGMAVTRPPIGYQESLRGLWILDPDLQVQNAIRRVFALYWEHRSVGKIVKAYRASGLLFPRRRRGILTGEPITRDHVYDLLTNPLYTGDYVYRRGAHRRSNGRAKPSRPPVVFEGHHEGYISREEGNAIQADLAARQPAVRPPVGDGSALLQGLLACGRCGRWMLVKYEKRARKGHPLKRLPHYNCARRDPLGSVDHHAACVAAPLDAAVVRHVLALLTPVSIETALVEIRVSQAADAEIHRAQDRSVRRAEEDVEESRARYVRVAAEHSRVKVDLEAQYEAALIRREALKQAITTARATALRVVTPDDATALLALANNLRAIWQAPSTSNEDRKQLLRTVLVRITLTGITPDAFHLDLECVGGRHEPLRVLRPQGVAGLAVDRALGRAECLRHRTRFDGRGVRERLGTTSHATDGTTSLEAAGCHFES